MAPWEGLRSPPRFELKTSLLLWALCVLCVAPAQERTLLQSGPSLCPLVYKSNDIKDTVTACARGSDPSSLVYNVPCCNRIASLLYQSWVRYSNATDQMLMPQEVATRCVQDLRTSLIRAGTMPTQLQSCPDKSTSLSQPACGAGLTTVTAFKEAANFSFPGTAGGACWNQPECFGCKISMSNKIATLARSPVVNGSLIDTDACKELASVALVAAAYPLVVANSIAQCLWNSPIDYLPQSATCTTQDFFNIDYTAAYRACGPPKIHSERCCDVILGMQGQVFYTWSNKSGLIDYQTEVEACLGSYRSALAAHGLPGSLVDQCKINSFVPLIALRCKNITDVPKPLLDATEAACAPGKCNSAEDCTDVLLRTAQTLRAPDDGSESQLEKLLCIFFLTTVTWPQFGPQGGVDRLNCYYDYPRELQLAVLPTNSSSNRTVPWPNDSKDGNRVALIASLVAGLGAVMAVLAGLAACWWVRRKQRGSERSKRGLFAAQAARGIDDGSEPMRWFSFSELRAATQNFAEKQMLGRGGSGKVYLGRLPGGGHVAVKELYKSTKPGVVEEFVTEMVSMVSCRHAHIVAPKGVHASDRRCILVYEYVANGSLQDHLFFPRADSMFPDAKRVFLSWPRRRRIAIGTAEGLAYLHEECKPRIIHRDVKPSNILLDEDLEAKVADFGLAKFTKEDETHVSTGVRGTWGYISPEYVSTGQVTDKSDVYSYGVVLLSLVSGRRPMDTTDATKEQTLLTEWAWDVAVTGDFLSMVDPNLRDDLPEHEASILIAIKVGLMCVHTFVNERPTMQECLAMLTQQMEVPPLPGRPMTFFSTSSRRTDDTSFNTKGSTGISNSTPPWHAAGTSSRSK